MLFRSVGQTEAAQDLCVNVPDAARHHYVQPGVGHFGIFNGRRWRTEIQPRIRDMIQGAQSDRRRAARMRGPFGQRFVQAGGRSTASVTL